MEKQKKNIFVDVDDVICTSDFLNMLNKVAGTNFDNVKRNCYYIDSLVSKEVRLKFYRYMHKHDPYENAVLFPNVKEVLERLCRDHNVYICSACVLQDLKNECGVFFDQKFSFLTRTFPFLDPDKIILTNSKNLFVGDIQIDDREPNLRGNNIKHKLLFNSFHNLDIDEDELKEKKITRVKSWLEIEEYINSKVK